MFDVQAGREGRPGLSIRYVIHEAQRGGRGTGSIEERTDQLAGYEQGVEMVPTRVVQVNNSWTFFFCR